MYRNIGRCAVVCWIRSGDELQNTITTFCTLQTTQCFTFIREGVLNIDLDIRYSIKQAILHQVVNINDIALAIGPPLGPSY